MNEIQILRRRRFLLIGIVLLIALAVFLVIHSFVVSSVIIAPGEAPTPLEISESV